MAALTSSSVWAVSPLMGVDVGAKSSTPAFKALTSFLGSTGYRYFYVKASEAIGSITTIKVGTAGSASDDSGSAGFTANVPGGAATGQYFWARKTAL